MVEVSQTKVGDMLGRLGVSAQVLDGKLVELARAPLAALKQLGLAYGSAAVDTNKFGNQIADGRINLPPFGYVPPPPVAFESLRRIVARTYHQAPGQALHPSHEDPFTRLFDRRAQQSAKLSRLLHSNKPVRNAFERVAGGQVVPDGRTDGRVSMIPKDATTGVSSSAMTGGAPFDRNEAYNLFMKMDQEVEKQARSLAPGSGSYATANYGGILGMDSIWADNEARGSFSSEDDEDSEEDEDSVQSSALRNSGGKTEVLPEGPNSSVDVGTLKLKRLMDRREQMYDLYRQTNDKYSQSAKQAIDQMKA